MFSEGALEVKGLVGTLSRATTVLGALEATRELLAEPRRRATYELATDEFGIGCHPWADSARCWCLAGALRLVDDNDIRFEAMSAIRRITGYEIGQWNDQASHIEVMNALDSAIDKARRAK